jgi:amino acid permease
MATVTFVVAGLMIALGVPGYLTFFNRSNGNILTNYAIDDPLIGVCRALVTVVVVCSYPLFNMPLRDSLFYLQAQFIQFQARRRGLTSSSPALQASSSSSAPPHNSHSSPLYSDEMTIDTVSTSSDEATTSTDVEMVRLDFDAISPSKAFSDLEIAHPSHLDLNAQPSLGTGSIAIQNVVVMDTPRSIPSSNGTIEETISPTQEQNKTNWMKSFVQTFVCWVLAFTLAYVIPDITVIIGFVASTFSPIYYFALPGIVALSLPEGRKATRIGGYFLLSLCAIFILSGLTTYFMPKNTVYPPLPSRHNATSSHTSTVSDSFLGLH